MDYRNLDLFLEDGGPETYPVLALGEVGDADDEARGELVMDGARTAAMGAARLRLEARDTDHALLESVGKQLFELLFEGACAQVGKLLERVRGGAAATGAQVRVRLRIQPPELAALPWELLFEPGRDEFLATSIETVLVRYVDLNRPTRAVTARQPLALLVAIPSAPDLAVDREVAALKQAFAGMEAVVTPTFLESPVTFEALERAIASTPFHVFHFVGHGEFVDGAAGLRIDSPEGGGEWLDGDRLEGLMRNQPTMKLVVLNACKGARVSETQPLVGLAPQLVRAGVPAVVAMQYAVFDEVAVAFARDFYFWLLQSWARGQVEVAVSQARSRLASDFPDERGFAAPVLYLRADEGMLFDVTAGSLRDVPILARDRARHDAMLRSKLRDVALLETEVESGADPLAPKALEEERQALRALQLRSRLAKGAALVGLGTAGLLFFLAWLGLFDVLRLAPFAHSLQATLAGAFSDGSLDDSIALVVADEGTAQAFGAAPKISAEWRPRHGALLDVLSAAGAKAVVFTISFPTPFERDGPGAPDDDDFAAAIAGARRRGTAVVVPVTAFVEGAPKISEKLRAALEVPQDEGARGSWGLGCFAVSWGFVTSVPIAVAPDGDAAREPRLGLPLAACAALFGAEPVEIDSRRREVILTSPEVTARRVAYGHEEELDRTPGCPALAVGDRVANVVFPPADPTVFQAPGVRFAYQDVTAARCGGDAPDALCGALAGKLVFVGSAMEADRIGANGPGALRGRYWVEFHADAADAILRGRGLRPLHPLHELLLMLLVAALAAVVRLAVPDARRLLRWACLGGLTAAVLLVPVWLVLGHNLMVGVVHQLTALAVAVWAAGWYDARWGRGRRPGETSTRTS